ncbi:MAG: hypothetical protein KatS3mg108_2422 [Isosphaeraceae bacterium]|jgi:hypothetical protein|nr:MAG: hypothetical protein KatS3mg108_2422 [Isosphaeraceae bacterium]
MIGWLRAVLAVAFMAGSVSAQPPHPPRPEPVLLTLHPAEEPIPALKYRLVPERRDLVPGNAALFYHRAILKIVRANLQRPPHPESASSPPGSAPAEKIAEWASCPIDQLDAEQARSTLSLYQTALQEAELGAFRRECEWEFDTRPEGLTLLLDEIQEMRSLARLVAVRARLAILDGDVDTAMHWIQVGYTLGRHTASGPTLIQALVGIAIQRVMSGCLQDLIQRPGTPSLYWALVNRPRPMVDLGRALEGERYLLERELPKLSELERGAWSQAEARRFVDELETKLAYWTAGPAPGSPTTFSLAALGRRLGIAAIAAKLYPDAKRRLIAQGRPADLVERMPVVQVAVLDTLLTYRSARDHLYKWMSLPYWQAQTGLDRASSLGLETPEAKLANPLLSLFALLVPPLKAALLGQVNLERQLDALQTIEAIRLAAKRDGTLPPTLEALPVPAPLDPATGQPFVYRLQDKTAQLSAPIPSGAPDHPSYEVRFILKLAP